MMHVFTMQRVCKITAKGSNMSVSRHEIHKHMVFDRTWHQTVPDQPNSLLTIP